MTATTDWALPEAEPSPFAQALRRRPWLAPSLVGVALGAATAYTAWQDPNAGGVFPTCPLKDLTGLDCPGCGGLRAVHALTQGDVVAAFDHNVLAAVLVPLFALAWAVWFVRGIQATFALRRERADGAPSPPPVPRRPAIPIPTGRLWIGLGVAALAFAVVRNIDAVPLFEYLASEA